MSDPIDLTHLSKYYPIALAPVRLETRFVPTASPPELRIRIYPDELLANVHEPRLTPDELADAEAFWNEAWPGVAQEQLAWARLVARYQTTRAAYLVRAATPTPASLAARPSGAPAFPTTIPTRTESLPSAQATLLPDAWVAVAYRGGAAVYTATSLPVVHPLQLAYRPDVREGDPSLLDFNGLKLEPELAWTVDYSAALAAGMAITIALTSTDLSLGFDQLFVLGVRTSVTSADQNASDLAALLDAHHSTRGLAFVRQGTPTNSTAAGASGYPPPDDAASTFAIERQVPALDAGSDARRLARALGLPDATSLDHMAGREGREDVAAGAMNRALWPTTIGYFLEHIAQTLTTAQLADVRAHHANHVRGRGPYAAIRVGRVPYGILPVTTLDGFIGDPGATTVETKLVALLAKWRTAALQLVATVPHVGATPAEPDNDLLGVLAIDASAREVRARETIGPAHVSQLAAFRNINISAAATARASLVTTYTNTLGFAGARFFDFAWANQAYRIARPFVTADPLSEVATLAVNYITQLRSVPVVKLRAYGQLAATELANPLLFHLLRQACLVELNRIGCGIANSIAPDRAEVELINIVPVVAPYTAPRPTPWARLGAAVAGVTGNYTLQDWLLQPSTDTARQPVRDYYAALDTLAALPTAELERLTTETLDVGAYRLDAWITSIATRRLDLIRSPTTTVGGMGKPTGVYLGAYAWVENLRVRSTPRPGTAGGFIHAPSAAHAATAAILRNGHLSRTGTERDQAAIALSSKRVRTALGYIDGVRQGQPLGALLGYRFERSLHTANRDADIASFRKHFPLGADPTSPTDPASERLSARAVTDGLALRNLFTSSATPYTDPRLSWVTNQATMTPLIQALDDEVDATADVLLSESVYQAVQGNVDRASATLGTLAGDVTLPMPEVTAMPRSAVSFTQRAAVILGQPPSPPPPGWPSTPRGLAEPRLEAWLRGRLGDPSRVVVTFDITQDPDGNPDTSAQIPFGDLGLGALDLLDLARRVPAGGGGDLDALVAYAAMQDDGPEGLITATYHHVEDRLANVALLELLDIARTLADVVASARPLVTADLSVDGSAPDATNLAELTGRANAARTSLSSIRTYVANAAAAVDPQVSATLDSLRSGLWGAYAYGIYEAAAANQQHGGDERAAALLAQVPVVLAEIDRRLAAATAATAPRDQLAAIFGSAFPVLPTFTPPNRADLNSALAAAASRSARAWLYGAARVRAPLAAVELAALASEAAGGAATDFIGAQLPYVAGGRWNGAAFDPADPAQAPTPGALSLVVHAALDTTAPTWAGLVLDQWTEAIPTPTQMTSLAVHHDSPGAEAGQCVLLAVSPNTAAGTVTGWSYTSLLAIVRSAFDLARIRAIDADALAVHAFVVPTTYLAANVADEAISLPIGAMVQSETLILAAES